MKGDHSNPSSGCKKQESFWKDFLKRLKLAVYRDPKRLKSTRRRMDASDCAPRDTAHHHRSKLPGGCDLLQFPHPRDPRCNSPAKPLLAIPPQHVRDLLFGPFIDDHSRAETIFGSVVAHIKRLRSEE